LLGAQHTLEVLRQAKEIIFPEVAVPVDTETRRSVMPPLDDPEPEWARKLNELDQKFYNSPDDITPRLEAFAREQGLID
jgi:hypothetical protein